MEKRYKVSVYLIPWQYFNTKEVARLRGMSMSDYVSLCLGSELHQMASKDEIDTILKEYEIWKGEHNAVKNMD